MSSEPRSKQNSAVRRSFGIAAFCATPSSKVEQPMPGRLAITVSVPGVSPLMTSSS